MVYAITVLFAMAPLALAQTSETGSSRQSDLGTPEARRTGTGT